MSRLLFAAVAGVLLLGGCATSDSTAESPDGIAVEILVMPRPEYPESALKAGVQGRVLVGAAVNEQGAVTHAAVVETSGSRSLDEAAVAAALKAKFAPSVRDGRPTCTRVSIPYEFRLEPGRGSTRGAEDDAELRRIEVV